MLQNHLGAASDGFKPSHRDVLLISQPQPNHVEHHGEQEKSTKWQPRIATGHGTVKSGGPEIGILGGVFERRARPRQ